MLQTLDVFEFQPRTAVVFGVGTFDRLGHLSRQLGFTRTLLVADRGLREAGHVDRAVRLLTEAAVDVSVFHDFEPNPDSGMVEAGRAAAAAAGIDSLVALGGGSSLDCAKGINFVLTNGGAIDAYRGYGKALQPMLPAIGVPTTAGTGSEAQSYAIISSATTHAKMACGDPKAAFRVAILDPALTVSQPRTVSAAAGYDAVSHAVEAYVTRTRTPLSALFARDAWCRLDAHFAHVLAAPDDLDARGAMLLGAHEAGVAIEQSMLGATHACANPLTARYGTNHAHAIAVMLPHVVRWNGTVAGREYAELLRARGEVVSDAAAGDRLSARLETLAREANLPGTLRDLGARRRDVSALAAEAAAQWTGSFNPRPFDAGAAVSLYERAY